MKRMIAFLLLISLCTGLCACGSDVYASSATLLTPKGAEMKPSEAELTKDFYAKQNDLAWKIFSSALSQSKEKNVLLSPLSIQIALCMTANGADGETLDEMEALLCGGDSIADWNGLLSSYLSSLPSEEKAKLHIANSIWYRGGANPIEVKDDFLNTCAYHYGAEVYRASFNEQAIRDINAWVSKNTDGMIPKMIEQLDSQTAMVLLNALCFDAKWQNSYGSDDIRDGKFTALDGSKQNAEFMYSCEGRYLRLPNAAGFVKSYAAGGYKFAALLPDEGVDIYEFVQSLSPEEIYAQLNQPTDVSVHAYLPKFSCEYGMNMKELLCSLGMPTAFDEDMADFSKMSITPLCIDDVIHKTKITVDESGTKAAASTAVIVKDTAAVLPQRSETVRLDRPFVYLILDSNNVPVFIGILTEISK